MNSRQFRLDEATWNGIEAEGEGGIDRTCLALSARESASQTFFYPSIFHYSQESYIALLACFPHILF